MVPGFDDFVVTERIPGNQENRSYSQITSSLQNFRMQNLGKDFLLKMSFCRKLYQHYLLRLITIQIMIDYAETIPATTTLLVKNDLKAECRIFSRVLNKRQQQNVFCPLYLGLIHHKRD